MPSVTLELVPPTFSWVPEYAVTLGPEVADLAGIAGFAADPEQRLVLDGMFAADVSGRSAVRDVGVCAPRQNMKTGLLKQAALGWLYILELRLIVWSAHEFSTAQEAFRDMCVLIESCPDLDREVKQIHRGNGEEAIELLGNRRLKFKARTISGGRGLTGDRIVLDESMYLKPSHLGALRPTLRAVKDPQIVVAGSAGLVDSVEWRRYRDRGRAGGDKSLAWYEWGDPNPGGCALDGCDHAVTREGCALDDRARWWACNTALGRRITEDTLAADRDGLPPEEFARETLGWWDDPPVGGGILDLDAWAELAREIDTPVLPLFAVEVTLERARSVIGAAWMADERPHLEVVEDQAGTDGLGKRLIELCRKYSTPAVVIDMGSEAAYLVPELEQAGIRIIKVGGPERSTACAEFYDAATSAALSHAGDPALAAAIAAARWKDVGDGARVFSRRKSAGPITELYAVTLALHGLITETREGGPNIW